MKTWEEKAETITEIVDGLRNWDADEFKYTKGIIKETEIAMLWFFITEFEKDMTPRLKETLETLLRMHIVFYEAKYGEIK